MSAYVFNHLHVNRHFLGDPVDNLEYLFHPFIFVEWRSRTIEMGTYSKQPQKSNRYNSILQWLLTEQCIIQTHFLSYPKPRDAIASKKPYQI